VLVRTLLSTNKLPKSFTVSTEKNDELMQSVMLSDVYVVEKKRGFLRKCFDMFAAKERALAAELRYELIESSENLLIILYLGNNKRKRRKKAQCPVASVDDKSLYAHIYS